MQPFRLSKVHRYATQTGALNSARIDVNHCFPKPLTMEMAYIHFHGVNWECWRLYLSYNYVREHTSACDDPFGGPSMAIAVPTRVLFCGSVDSALRSFPKAIGKLKTGARLAKTLP
jgi:hypothetical protein